MVLRRIFGPKRDEVIEKNEIGGACSADGGGERRV
jgi:hypothetical protein